MFRPHLSATVAVFLMCVSTAAFAQRGGGGGGGFGGSKKPDFGTMIKESPVGLRLSNGDVEDMNPVKLLADKRKDLKLTDDQQKRLRAMDDSLKEINKPHFKALDSLRAEIRPRAGADVDAERIRTQIARETVVGAVKVIRGNYAAALKNAMAVLDDTQRPKAEELVATQAKHADETLQDKLGAGRGDMR